MHTVVLKQALYDQHPWLAQSLTKAFTRAKALCLESMTNLTALRYMLPWMTADVEEMIGLMGDDPWPYGVDRNRETIETLLGDLQAQGLMPSPITVDELFAANTLRSFTL